MSIAPKGEFCSRDDLPLDIARLQSGWTPERVVVLRALWKAGFAASQIAAQLGGITRNAAIGKLHRLGEAKRATGYRPPSRANRGAYPQRKTRQPSAPKLRTPPIRTEEDTEGSGGPSALRFLGIGLDVLTITEATCKFPEGDPKHADFAFCGRPAMMALCAYCPEHARLAYQPSTKKRDVYAPTLAVVKQRIRYGWGSHL